MDCIRHRPRLRPGDVGYYSSPRDGVLVCCRAVGNLLCTREKGHEPPCAAHGYDHRQIATAALPGDDPDAPRCYVKGCGETEGLEPCFIGQWVCPECKASYQHQEALRQEFGAEGRGG